MSLINQALRKAQRDRTPNRMSPPGEQSPSAYAGSAASGLNPAIVIGLIITLAVLIGLVAGLSVVIFKGESSPDPQITTSNLDTPASKSTIPSSTHTLLTPVDPQITPSSTTTAPALGQPEMSVVEELRKARRAAEAQVAAEAKIADEAAARATAQPNEDVIDWLSSAKLSAVRMSEAGSKVILNGSAYSVGDSVDLKLGLKIMAIQETRVLFVDKNGERYIKRL